MIKINNLLNKIIKIINTKKALEKGEAHPFFPLTKALNFNQTLIKAYDHVRYI